MYNHVPSRIPKCSRWINGSILQRIETIGRDIAAVCWPNLHRGAARGLLYRQGEGKSFLWPTVRHSMYPLHVEMSSGRGLILSLVSSLKYENMKPWQRAFIVV